MVSVNKVCSENKTATDKLNIILRLPMLDRLIKSGR